MIRSGLQLDDPARQGAVAHRPLPPAGSPPVAGTTEETIFSLLAGRARSHSVAHLILTAAVGLIDAAALAWNHPAAWSIAALCAAAGAYGLWGLLDRAVGVRLARGLTRSPLTMFIRTVREMVALGGFAAAIAAAAGVFSAALGTWIS